jgi:hypothetical protein
MMSKLVPSISQVELCQTVTRLDQTLDRDYAGQSLLKIGILKLLVITDLKRSDRVLFSGKDFHFLLLSL